MDWPETPEGVALALMMVALRRAPDCAQAAADIIALYRLCLAAVQREREDRPRCH
jgi:hypothetical protein